MSAMTFVMHRPARPRDVLVTFDRDMSARCGRCSGLEVSLYDDHRCPQVLPTGASCGCSCNDWPTVMRVPAKSVWLVLA